MTAFPSVHQNLPLGTQSCTIQTPYPQYLSNIANFKWRNALTALRCQSKVSAVAEGRYHQIPWEERTCLCGTMEVEDLIHYLINCPIYKVLRANLFREIGLVTNRPDTYLIIFLLGDRVPHITEKVVCFAFRAPILRKKHCSDKDLID